MLRMAKRFEVDLVDRRQVVVLLQQVLLCSENSIEQVCE